MPVELGPAVEIPIAPHSPIIYPPRKGWTRAECESLEATGLWNRDRLELIEGELITKMPKNRLHVIVFTYVEGESVAPLALPSALFPVASAFPFPPM